MVEKPSIFKVQIERTTVVPHGMMDRMLMSNTANSSKHFHESVHALQSAMKILFPKKKQQEKNFSVDRQSLLIGCVINRANASEEQRRACKGLHERNDKNVFYEFDDKSFEENSTVKNHNHLPIHIEHINVARVENNQDKLINGTIEKIQNLINIENRFINKGTDGERIHLDPISQSSSSQNFVNSSKLLGMRLDAMHADRPQDKKTKEGLQRSSNNYTSDKTADKEMPLLKSIYSMSKQNKDNHNDREFLTLNQNNFSSENEDNHNYKLNINMDNKSESINDTNEKLDQQNRTWNKSTAGIWSISRLSNNQMPKNVLLTDLTKALETLETIADGKGLDSDGDQISFKPVDLRSIIKPKKFSGKFLQFLNTIKNTIEQSDTDSTN